MMADGRNDTALGLGERLRSARKARALTLDQAAMTLRVDISVLRALEEERYDALGAAVFVRGHLKAYSRLLGLSEEAVLAAYRAADPAADVPPRVARDVEKPLTTTPGPFALVAAFAFAILAGLAVYTLGSRSPSSSGLPAVPAVEETGTTDGMRVIEVVPLPVEPQPAPQDTAPASVTPDAGPPAGTTPDTSATPAETAAAPGTAVAPAPAPAPATGNFE